jgi:hypothetical protein
MNILMKSNKSLLTPSKLDFSFKIIQIELKLNLCFYSQISKKLIIKF